MLTVYEVQGYQMSLKVHFLHSHLEYLSQSMDFYTEEQGGKLHQDLRTMGKRYQGRMDVNMMGDYFWMLK